MSLNLVKSILAVLLLSTPVWAEHDCRIHHLQIGATRRDNVLVLRAFYIGYDGEPLSQTGCPDQNGPTWGLDRDIASMSSGGFRITIQDPTGEVLIVSIATVQHPDRSFYVERRIRF